MIHYHGLPITPHTVAAYVVGSGHAFISMAHIVQLSLAVEICQSFAADNAAFSHWMKGEPKKDWSDYYQFIKTIKNIPNFDFACIPDVIDGTAADNDALLREWPHGHKGAPVWHLHEPYARLERLAAEWPRVCLGSSGDYSRVGAPEWWKRMEGAMDAVCDKHGRPVTKLHGLRMLNVKIFTHLPLSSADSTSIGRNIGIDKKWHGTFAPPTKESRAWVMKTRIEHYNAPDRWDKKKSREMR